MANKMLIDATHPEETRVVVLRGNRVEEFDFESASRRQLRGNIYLAKVTRVEPSLQAAFVDYGGNRHGFLAFSEIHPDYYQIPVADRQALIDEEERAHRDAEAEADRRANQRRRSRQRAVARPVESITSDHLDAVAEDDHQLIDRSPEPPADEVEPSGEPEAPAADSEADEPHARARRDHTDHPPAESERAETRYAEVESSDHEAEPAERQHAEPNGDASLPAPLEQNEAPSLAGEPPDEDEAAIEAEDRVRADLEVAETAEGDADGNGTDGDEEEVVESVGGDDALEEVPDRTPRYRRQYKIQEVIKRRQIMLVQVVKEERGTKGAALTTYLSLAGRYSVLMPNTARGGGISRKITNIPDRKRLKEVAQELEVPEGMGVILRTAGAARTKTEINRDFEYLLRAWETVRDLTLKSTAPTLVYEEGSLVKRSIRDLYNKDIDEVIVAGEEAYRDARDFMRMLMPSHARNVKAYKESQPILTRYGIESQLDAMFSPVVQLRSGGYVVLNQAEALVAIDVNSGRATREHHIEDTALKTNLEAAEEIARQLRLRDLAGLIVIDFIDMDEKRNNRSVERRLKDCLKNDRARIQVGRISHFGLLEMSRQRIRTSVLESSTDKCPHCGGTGHVRAVSSVALQCLRMIEEQLQRGATHNIILRTRSEIALYVLNHKRAHLYDLEHRFKITIAVNVDPTISGQLPFVIERGELVHSLEQARALAAQSTSIPIADHDAEAIEETDEAGVEDDEETDILEAEANGGNGGNGERAESADRAENGEAGRRRRRRRRRGRRGEAREGGSGQEAAQGRNGERETEPEEQREPAYAGPHLASRDEASAGIRADGSVSEHRPEHMPEHVGEALAEQAGHDEAGESREVEAESSADSVRAGAPDDDNGDAARRRRRRGRRGGRRNRREEGETAIVPSERDVPPIDEELAHAGADFGGPRIEDLAREAPDIATAHHPEPAASPQAATATPAANEAAVASAKPEPRRRSTVREPAPMAGGVPAAALTQTLPVGADAASSTAAPSPPSADATSEPAAPRRAGWWAKRVLGEKG
jgi:ribonuclease E